PAACVETLSNRIERIDEALAKDTSKEGLEEDRSVLQELRELVQAVDEKSFSKYRTLIDELEGLGYGQMKAPSERVIVFSERISTLEWLSEALRARFSLGEDAVRIFHAGLPDVDQTAIVDSFGKQDSSIRVLLASDVASEGVNLHFFCHRMFHFDVPWSLIKLEQRNGRIDRFGQRHTPVIRYLLTTSEDEEIKGDTRIIERLIEKEEYAYKNIGDAAVLMGLYSAASEEEAVARAIERDAAPEEVVPDTPPEIDFLQLLEAGAADGDEEEITAAPTCLYDGDYAF